MVATAASAILVSAMIELLLDDATELLLIDGNRFTPYFGILHQCIVQGDAKYASIAAASILAKTHRDEYMQKLHEIHPEYGWCDNKGYGTPYHKQQLRIHGMSPFHRKTFQWDKAAVELAEEG